MTTGLPNARSDYLHTSREDGRKCSHSSFTLSSSTELSLGSIRSRHRCRSDVDIFENHHNYNAKTGSQYRRRNRSVSESPPPRHYSGRTSRDRHRMRQARDHPQASRCIGVFGLNTVTTQQEVRELFNKFGPIERIQMVIDAHSQRSRGFCFIYFESLSDARVAKDACTGMEVDGRRIRVDYSITQRAHTPTPGVYMGRPSRPMGRRSVERNIRDGSRSRRRYRDDSASVSPYDANRRKYRSRHRYERSRSRTYSRSRSPRKHRISSRY